MAIAYYYYGSLKILNDTFFLHNYIPLDSPTYIYYTHRKVYCNKVCSFLIMVINTLDFNK